MTDEKPTLLQLRPIPLIGDADQQLAKHFTVIQLSNESDTEAALRACQDRVVIITTSGGTPVPADFIDRFPKLQVICNWGVGYDSIDVRHAQQKGIQVSNTPDVLNDCVADLTWGLIIATARRMGQNERYVRANRWNEDPANPLGIRVSGKKLGIVGLGRVGRAITQRAAGFNMDIRYHNRRPRQDTDYGYEKSLVELATWADFLVVATVGGPSTRHLIDHTVLKALGPDSLLINISRGSVVDEAALVNALANGELGGAGLDVFDDEPHIPDELKNMDNVVLLPHIGSATTETRTAMSNLVLENVESFATTGQLLTPIAQIA